MAGLALPGVVLVGAVTKSAAKSVEGEPAGLDPKQPARPSVLYAADGKTRIATFYAQYRWVVPTEKISPTVVKSLPSTLCGNEEMSRSTGSAESVRRGPDSPGTT